MTESTIQNHKGFTLVEMITAFAVLGIAVIAIGAFFVTSSRSYAGTSKESAIQYEAQLALNQIENMLLDSSMGVNYNLVTNESNKEGFHFVNKDNTSVSPLVSKVMYVFNVDANGKYNALLLKWYAADKCLYYKKVPITNTITEVSQIPIAGISDWDLLAEGVETFSMDLSKYAETKSVEVGLHLKQRDKEYKTEGTITIRNDISINEQTISEIYRNISSLMPSIIDSIKLTSNTNVTVPGGTIQLSTEVIGTYPSQTIHRWLVATDSGFKNIIFDSKNYTDEALETLLNDKRATLINPADKILQVSEDKASTADTRFKGTIYIQARVNTKDAEGKKIERESNTLPITVADIEKMEIWPGTYATSKVVSSSSTEADIIARTAKVVAGDKIQMDHYIYDSNNNRSKGTIKWTITNKTKDCIVDITETGLITVNNLSPKGTFIVTASLVAATEAYSVDYYFNIGSKWEADNYPELVIKPIEIINRGGSHQCVLTLNGVEQNPLNYNWNVTVSSSNGQIVSNAATIDEYGFVKVSEDLAFDYNYSLAVEAALKSDSDLNALEVATIPRVRLVITPTAKRAYLGTTIEAGQIVCTVTGLEKYDIQWSMAKATNPNYYYTASGNSNITGKTHTDGSSKTPIIVIGADEPDNLEYIRVKATLKDYANYYTTMKLNFKDVISDDDMGNQGNTGSGSGGSGQGGNGSGSEGSGEGGNIDPTQGAISNKDKFKIIGTYHNISRGGSIELEAEYESSVYGDIDVTKESTWKVFIGNTEVTGQGVTINSYDSPAVVSVSADFMADIVGQDIDLTIYAYFNRYGTIYYDKYEVTIVSTSVKMEVYKYSIMGTYLDTIDEDTFYVYWNANTTIQCTVEGMSETDLSYSWELKNPIENQVYISNNTPTTSKQVTLVTSYYDFNNWPNDLELSVSVYQKSTGKLIGTITKDVYLTYYYY